MKKIVIFASGNGSNADNICHYFSGSPDIQVAAVFCNNPHAGVITKMEKWQVPVELFNKNEFNDADSFLPLLQPYQPDLIVLAGFLWLVPAYLVLRYPNRIINIHPALLPKFGGKGMYGQHVHEAVLAQKETQHGISIHYVDEQYDEGKHLFQQAFEITDEDDINSIAAKISALEMEHFPKVIERLLLMDND